MSTTSHDDESEFHYKSGRRYHNKKAVYDLPNDDEEVKRLNGQHPLFKQIIGTNFHSRVRDALKEKGACVLDAGCGTGVWSIDNAREFPNAMFYGMDLSPIFAKSGLPPNVQLQEGNVLEGLPFNDAQLDLVFSRLLYASLTKEQWFKYINEALRVLKPGGWLELHELLCVGGPHFEKIWRGWVDFLAAKQIKVEIGPDLPKFLESTGRFTNIEFKQTDQIMGPRGGKVGEELVADVSTVFKTLAPLISAQLGISTEEYDELLKNWVEECKTRDNFLRLQQVFGQKG